MIDAIVASVISGLIVAGVVTLVFNRIAKKQEETERAHRALICSRLEVDDAQDEVLIATAIAVRDHKTNGEMSAALEKMKKAKQKQAAIVREQVAANF